MERNELVVLEAEDDDGHPFVMFRYGPDILGGTKVYLEILAKRLKEGSISMVPLIPTEESHLEIGLSCSEMAKRAHEDEDKDDKDDEEDAEVENGVDGELDDTLAKPVKPTKWKVHDTKEHNTTPDKKSARNK